MQFETHCINKRIYYHDTDCGGVVYYANYLKYLEEGRTEYFCNKGVDLRTLSNNNFWFVVKSINVEYKSPVRYQDEIRICTSIDKIGNASIKFHQIITKDDVIVLEANVILVCVGIDFKPSPIPTQIKSSLLK
ncbi:MAG: acyl-CoA thioesterase [Candidatus Omnitrophica bacterium]|nr:acyl-CoA thioesterase [Candidatus Omnitrophota bacterium]